MTSVKDGDETVGSRVKVRVVKNKVAPPFKQAEFDLMHDHGISREGDLLDLGLEDKIIDKSGAWISYGDVRLGQGRENAKQYLRDNPALVEEITRKSWKSGLVSGPARAAAESNGEGHAGRQAGNHAEEKRTCRRPTAVADKDAHTSPLAASPRFRKALSRKR